jgi:hypothetical protein
MGCDIHLDVEVRTSDGTWQALPRARRPNGFGSSYAVDHYDGRNYGLFAILADVRNDGFKPISPRRGVAPDVSSVHRKRTEDYMWDGHSHSWHTLRHLLDFNWDQKGREDKPYSYWLDERFAALLLRMWRWSDGRPDDVRIVFFFDS